ncbi:MAG: hypothetical protein Q9159_002715 [Coniocarpon cinnabarinum]
MGSLMRCLVDCFCTCFGFDHGFRGNLQVEDHNCPVHFRVGVRTLLSKPAKDLGDGHKQIKTKLAARFSEEFQKAYKKGIIFKEGLPASEETLRVKIRAFKPRAGGRESNLLEYRINYGPQEKTVPHLATYPLLLAASHFIHTKFTMADRELDPKSPWWSFAIHRFEKKIQFEVDGHQDPYTYHMDFRVGPFLLYHPPMSRLTTSRESREEKEDKEVKGEKETWIANVVRDEMLVFYKDGALFVQGLPPSESTFQVHVQGNKVVG